MPDNDEITLDDEVVAIEDISEKEDIESGGVQNIVPFIKSCFKKAEDYRWNDEERWTKAYRNYRGLYGPDVQFTESEKSRVFIKVTKTKTLAAYGQIVDVLFAGNKFPISIEPTELPEGIAKDVHFDPKLPKELQEEQEGSPYGYPGDGKEKI